MTIPLNHPIWPNLYGPYDREDISPILSQLSQAWDQDLADDLYWEKLHHQDTLYPVTFAALPILWRIAPRDFINLNFFAHILRCTAHGIESAYEHGRYYPDPSLEDAAQQALLTAQEQWWVGNQHAIAEACLNALPLAQNETQITYLLCGPCATRDASALSFLMEMIGQDYGDDDIDEAISRLTAKDMTAAVALLPHIEDVSPTFAKSVREALLRAPNDVQKDSLTRDTDTPDLFA
ncbi:hypothetical protein shim_28690 [Shimia sp. SK013]|uniref:hypothetical protein n=1 Tax=Shimia sp. SK013 TaxID=1389006 RepID=UPI0006B46CFB|nr:hypothetical protein [Shimia sp. SK013]KPA20953.1 hypothetical protein shim_28690 [Shimia sp. SK013]